MRVSTDISKTSRKTVFVNNLDGVDFRGSGGFSRGLKASNLINKNGKIVKRNGWKEQYKFDSKIDYVSAIAIGGNKYLFVYSGKKFYLIQDDNITDITNSASDDFKFDTEKLKERPLTLLERNDVYYIVGAGIFLELGDFGNGIELRSVSKNAYVPTTTIGIMPEGKTVYIQDKTLDDSSRGIWYIKTESGYSSVALTDENPWNVDEVYFNRVATYQMNPVKMEESNILTPYRINTLYGVNSSARYKLDSENILRDKNIRVKLKVLESGETNEYTLNEVATSSSLRGIEKGDNLKSKTIKITENENPILCSGLQNGVSKKGKVILKGKEIECFWSSTGVTALGWNSAKLIFKYKNEDDVPCETVIAVANRNGMYEPYKVYFQENEFTISGTNDAVVEEISNSHDFSEYVKAMLPSYTYNLLDQNLLLWGSLNHKTGELNFVKSTTSPDGEDNIEVLFSVSESEFDADAIDNCTLATEFGVDGNTDRLFLSGNENLKNLDFASDSGDYTYFPSDYVYKFGLESTPITGYSRLSDDSLAVFKDTYGDESNIYIRRGKYVNKSVNVGENTFTYKKAEFSLSGSYISNSSINGRLNKIFDGEPIFLTRRGIYTLKSSIDLMSERKSAVERGGCVNNVILDDLENVRDAIIFNNDYYLLVGKRLFIAKSNSYFMENNYKQYNWWVFENIPACTLAVIDDELWFGCEDGRICKFTDEYKDVFYEDIGSGSLLFSAYSRGVSFSEKLMLKKDETLILDGEIYMLLYENINVFDGKISVDDVSNLGCIEVYADKVGTSGLSVDTPYIIGNIDLYNNTFELFDGDTKVELSSGNFRLSVLLNKKPIKVKNLEYSLDLSANDVCSFTYLNRDILPIKYNTVPVPVEVSARRIREFPVISEWKTNMSDLNAPTMLKNIHCIGLEFGQRSGGKVRLLVEGKNAISKTYQTADMLNLLYPNLANFSFASSYEKSVYADARFRGINQMSLVIISDDDKPFELKSFSVEYSLLKQKRGIVY